MLLYNDDDVNDVVELFHPRVRLRIGIALIYKRNLKSASILAENHIKVSWGKTVKIRHMFSSQFR